MRQMRRVEAFEVLEQPHRVEARLTCGHMVESWGGQAIGALRRCRECERATFVPLPGALAGEETKDAEQTIERRHSLSEWQADDGRGYPR